MTARAATALRTLRGLARRGTFTVADAEHRGIPRRLLSTLAANDQVARFGRGVYMLTIAQHRRDDLVAAWRAIGEDAIVSHESALELYDICDVAPTKYDFTIPRNRRYIAGGGWFRLHTATTMPPARYLRAAAGVPVTMPARTIVDCAARISGEQLELAVATALRRRLVTTAQLRSELVGRRAIVRTIIEDAIERAARR